MRLAKDGSIILDLDDVVESNHISCQTEDLSLIQFGRLEPVVLYEHRLPSPAMQEGFFTISIFDKLSIDITPCFEVEEETGEEVGK